MQKQCYRTYGTLGMLPPVISFPEKMETRRAHDHSHIASFVTVLVSDYYVCLKHLDQLTTFERVFDSQTMATK